LFIVNLLLQSAWIISNLLEMLLDAGKLILQLTILLTCEIL